MAWCAKRSRRQRRGDDADTTVADRVSTPGRFVASSFTGATGTRAFKLFAPAGFDGESLPLVVMLHGCTQDPDDFAAGTRMNELAQAEGFFVLYPAQAARSNSHKCWNWFSPADQRRGAGEPALLAGMVRHVLQTHSIDPDRVYVAGLSAGGAMAAILASEYPDLFAAAGVHSGVAAGAASDVPSAFSVMKNGPAAAPPWPSTGATHWPTPAREAKADASPRRARAPVIVFHGDADATVTAANGDAVIAAALDGVEAVAEKVAGNAAAGAAPRSPHGLARRQRERRCADAGRALARRRRAARLVGRSAGRLVHRSRGPGRVARDAALLPRPPAPARLTMLRLLPASRAGAADPGALARLARRGARRRRLRPP